MWTRLFAPDLPSPLSTKDLRHKKVRERLIEEDGDDARPSSCKKRARYSIHPIFEKYKPRKSNEDDVSIDRIRNRQHVPASLSPELESPLVKELHRNYAALRVTLHSNALKQVEETQEALTLEVEDKIDASLAKLSKIAGKTNQLSTSCFDCEVEQQISTEDNQQRMATVQVRAALSRYQELEAERSKRLSQLWGSWEKMQTNTDKLSNQLQLLFDREPAKGTRRISSLDREWADQEDLELSRRGKLVVEDMAACEDELIENLEDEAANIAQAILNQ